MRYVITVAVLAAFLSASAIGHAAEKTITLIHTNDLHSHLMPFAPELDFVADETGVDDTMGGWARIATVLRNEREKRNNPVFIVDSGDFTMGTLFHMPAREKSFELRLMHEMGYDFVTLGNHEFDMFPDGLARIITTAHGKRQMPEIVFSSAVFSDESDKDNTLEEVFERGLVSPYQVVDAGGVKIGFFGIMGKIAAGDAPFAAPVTFRDPVEVSREMVRVLREEKKADIVICLSHSGIDIGSVSEDRQLASEVSGIDVIISGHSHTLTDEPLLVNSTIIVQADHYGKAVGVLDVTYDGQGVSLKNFKPVIIDDAILADPEIQSKIDSFIDEINELVLKEHGLKYWKIIGKTDFDMHIGQKESTAGNLLADAVRWYANRYAYDPDEPSTKVRMAIKANGVIRAGLPAGNTGKLAVADVFRTLPLGIGMDEDNSPGYPIVTCYLHPYEIKRALEVITSVYPLRGSAYFLQVSGVKFTYNPYRVLFDRVTEIWIEDENGDYKPLDYSRGNKDLYRVAANIYEATFLQVIGSFTWNILDIVPKDGNGNPIESLVDFRIDANPSGPAIQELKEWVAIMEYIGSFPDTTGDGLSDVPDKYSGPLGRIVEKPSINPINILHRGTAVTWAAFAAIVAAAMLSGFIFYLVIRRIRK